jgi:hypothetical protein
MDRPDVVATLRGDLADWRQWMARAVVLAHAAAAGLAIVAFTEQLRRLGHVEALHAH